MRIATYNVQNLRVRQHDGQPILDGAVDEDYPKFAHSAPLDLADRERTAEVIKVANADFLAMQEVFNKETLDFFHDRMVVPAGSAPYPHRCCLPGNDGHSRNVAMLSRSQPKAITSHADATGEDLDFSNSYPEFLRKPVFRRDCLEVFFDCLTIFICHFKAPYPDIEKARHIREAEALAVRRIIELRFAHPGRERWLVLGDFNEPAEPKQETHSVLEPLLDGFAIDLMDRVEPDAAWTYETPFTHLRSLPDRILVSPRLSTEYPETCPKIIRTSVGGPRRRPHASDHALVYADFDGLLAASS